MTVRLYAMTCGWLTVRLRNFLEGEEGELRVPVPSYLVQHPEGQVLFDSGLHVHTQEDPEGRLGFLAKMHRVHFRPGEELAARLEGLEVDAGRIRYLVNSHLHFDHAGGNHQIPNAQLVVQRREWEAGHDPDLMQANGYMAEDYDLGHDRLLVEGEHDLFGDGSVTCLPTYGHTPGHQSLRVELPEGPVVLAGDACYLRQTLEKMHLPRVVHDREEMLRSLARLRQLRDAGARIFYGHDPVFWETLPQAPHAIR